ncbi:MAG: hypothetical protein Kow0068_19900 [Marinilabiliales bacterium]
MLRLKYFSTNIIIIVFITILIFACNENKKNNLLSNQDTIKVHNDSIVCKKTIKEEVRDTPDIEKVFIKEGLIDIWSLDSSIHVDLKYSSEDNFVGMDLYGDLVRAYLQKDAAEKLVNAQKLLNDTLPGYHIIIYDAARPKSIQQIIWDNFDKPPEIKRKYLANPKYTSMHSYGIAVDVSILDDNDEPLDMGTDFDSFSELSYPILEEKFLKSGKLTEKQYNNRKLLRYIMEKSGFNGISTEWWHFSLCGAIAANQKYKIIESHISQKDIQGKETGIQQDKTIDKENINISFKVQIKTSVNRIKNPKEYFKGLEVWEYYHEGMYKYTVGEFKNLAEAYKMRDKMRELGYADCFVAGFNNNERIGIRDAVNLIQE